MDDQTGGAGVAAKPSFFRRVWHLIQILNVRLRFVFLMIVVGLVVGYWENISNRYDRWRRPARAPDLVAAAEIEYYCPMHPNIVRATVEQCPICGMPLARRPKSAQVLLPEGVLARQQLTPLKVQMGRIASAPVEYRLLSREIRTVGIVEYDETRRKRIAARIKGRIDKLMVNFVGQQVQAGDPLALLYSPELLTAQQELLTAGRQLGGGQTADHFVQATSQALFEASRQKLLLWGITAQQIEDILQRGAPETHLTISSPVSGIVTEKRVLEGHYVDEGMELYVVADLSKVWLQAKIFEDDLAGVEIGTAVEVTSEAYPGDTFAGRITFISYAIDPATRTAAARVEIANPGLKLKPGMYGRAIIRVPLGKVTEIDPQGLAVTPPVAAGGERAVDTAALAHAYLAFTSALVRDGTDADALAALVGQAKTLAAAAPGMTSAQAAAVAQEAAALQGKDVQAQRGLLRSLSARVIELLRARPPAGLKLYVAHCPMVEADWVQTGEELANPYMGSAMPRCGALTGTITARAVEDHGQFVTGYFCPVAPGRLFEKPESCPIDGFPLKFVRAEKTLAVPASAVVNTGTRKVVYRESGPGIFDMLEVQVGPRAGEYYPVLSGLNPGDRVATSGAFLVDAENRLNPAAAVQYFGASGSPQPAGTGGGGQH